MTDRPLHAPETGGNLLAAPHSRRAFLKGMSLAAGATVALGGTSLAEAQKAEAPASSPQIPGVQLIGRGPREIVLKVNGADRKVTVESRTTLLDALRMKLDQTGAKDVCDRGTCGCCTVLLNGRSVVSCLILAHDAVGQEITTVEGIAEDPGNKALIDGFCAHDAAQCGFCIPGFVVRSAAYLKDVPHPNADQVREGLSGNICRCGTYSKIFEAVEAAGKGAAK